MNGRAPDTHEIPGAHEALGAVTAASAARPAPPAARRASPDASPAPVGRLDAHLVVRRPAFVLDLPLTVEPGEVVALVGPNGSGKSTALRAVAGLVPLSDGYVRLGDRVLDDGCTHVHPERRGCGIVFQDHLLFDHMSALENVAFGRRAARVRAREAREHAAAWLDRLGLSDHHAARASRLSGGQAQRVALARALAADPDIVLLDEPFAALDVRTRVDVRDVLRAELVARPRPVLLITHDQDDSADLADRVIALDAGRLRADDWGHRGGRGGRVVAGVPGHGPAAPVGTARSTDPTPAVPPVGADPVGVVVLAGGTARRLGGGDKTALDVGGMTILDRLLADVAPLPTVVVADPPTDPTHRPAHARWVREEPVGSGPAAALAAGAGALPEAEVLVVLAGDQPFAGRVVPRLLAALAARPGAQAAQALTEDGHHQPLLAAYRVEAVRERLAAIRPGDRVRVLHEGLVVASVPVAGDEGLDVDDPADLDRARTSRGLADG